MKKLNKFTAYLMSLLLFVVAIAVPVELFAAEAENDEITVVARTAIDSGRFHSVAIDASGVLWIWGNNWNGQLGTGGSRYDEILRPVRVMDNVIAVSAGSENTFAITVDGELWAWGENNHGQLGDGTTTNRFEPVLIKENIIAVSASGSHTMAIDEDGGLWAWGRYDSGELGNGTVESQRRPVLIMDNVIAVSISWGESFAITEDGKLWGWGQRDRSSTDMRNITPLQILENVVAISVGTSHRVAITTDGGLWAWGRNSYGQVTGYWTLGTTFGFIHAPTRVKDNVIAASAGADVTLAITEDGTLWRWGRYGAGGIRLWKWGRYGAGGFSMTASTTLAIHPIGAQSFTRVKNNVVAVSGGIGASLLITSDGELWGWGRMVSRGVTGTSHIPIRIMPKQTFSVTPCHVLYVPDEIPL